MLYLGIDIGGMSVKIAIVDVLKGEILDHTAIPTEADQSTAEEIVARTCAAAKGLLAEHGLAWDDVTAIGAGSPGTSDNRRGLLLFAGNLPFKMFKMREAFVAHSGRPFYLGNDANVAALAETRLGAGRGVQSSLTVTLGTGIGVGFVVNDRIYSGFNGTGVEAGHMVIQFAGEPCGCGRQGCFEAYAAASALQKQAARYAEGHPDWPLNKLYRETGEISGKALFEAYAADDAGARQLIADYIRYLGIGLANFVNIYCPEMIILGGGISRQGEWFRAAVEAEMLKSCFDTGDLPQTRVAIAQMGNEAGMIGAALFARDCREDGLQGL